VPPTPREAMFVPFTDRVREVMNLAEQEARRLKHEYVGTEHILLGLFKAQPGVGVTVLRNLGTDGWPGRSALRKPRNVRPDDGHERARCIEIGTPIDASSLIAEIPSGASADAERSAPRSGSPRWQLRLLVRPPDCPFRWNRPTAPAFRRGVDESRGRRPAFSRPPCPSAVRGWRGPAAGSRSSRPRSHSTTGRTAR